MKALTYIHNAFRGLTVAMLLLGSVGAFAQVGSFTNPPLPAGESEKIDAYLQDFHAGVIITKTITNSYGQNISCVDIHHQPSTKRLPKGQQIQLRPSEALIALLPNGSTLNEDDSLSPCERGSVPMILPTREQILRFGSLAAFHSKFPDGSAGRFGTKNNNSAAPTPCAQTIGNCHEHAVYGQYAYATAIQSTINVWQPTVETDTTYWGQFSLSQLWGMGGSDDKLQTVEVGVHVFPKRYLDSLPHIFIYATPDGYGFGKATKTDADGCYNDCANFVLSPPGTQILGAAVPGSTPGPGGTQVEGSLGFWRDPDPQKGHHWWLFYVDGTTYTPIGYYPESFFSPVGKPAGALSLTAPWIEFGGEIYSEDTLHHTTTQMGSGQFPSAGYRQAAYQRNLIYLGTDNSVHNFQRLNPWPAGVTNSNCYDISDVGPGTDSSWGSYIFFGGPGFSTICPSPPQ